MCGGGRRRVLMDGGECRGWEEGVGWWVRCGGRCVMDGGWVRWEEA